MSKSRLEAFSDGVFAILITILVLEMKVPKGAGLEALKPVLPVFLTYILSFIYLGIYWNNHHHMFHAAGRINGAIMWGNLHLLFWLSLVPFTTGWMGHNDFSEVPTALYGIVLLLSALAYGWLQRSIILEEGEHSKLAKAIGADLKGKLSPVLYVVGVGFSFVRPWLAQLVYVIVAAMWFIPDRRLEKVISSGQK